MSYSTEGRGYGKLKEGATILELSKALRPTGFDVEEDGGDSLLIDYDGGWREDWSEKTMQVFLKYCETLHIEFEGEDRTFWTWEIKDDLLYDQKQKLSPDGKPSVYKPQ